MSPQLTDTDLTQDLIDRVMRLSTPNKDKLIELLIEESEPPPEDPAAVREAWREELGRRFEDLRSGRVQPVDGEEAFARTRKWLQEKYGV